MKKLFVIAVILFVASCKGGEAVPEADGVKTVYVEPLIGSEQVVKLSEVASKVLYIPLETSQESLVGDVRHAHIENNVIYLPDMGAKKLSRFSPEGKYLGSVGRNGRAYGEFATLTGFSFDYDYEKGAELLFDLDKLIEYHKDGSVSVVQLDRFEEKTFEVNFIKKLGNKYICAISRFGTDVCDLVYLDSTGKLIGEIPDDYKSSEYKEQKVQNVKQGEMIFSAVRSRAFAFPYRFGSRLMVTYPSNDTIMAYKPDDTIPKLAYVIDYGQYAGMKDEFGDDFIKLISTFTRESKNHLFLTFNFGKYRTSKSSEMLTRVLFDKSTGEAKSLLGRLENNIDGGPSFWPLHVSRDGQMIAIIQAIDFIEAAKECNSAEMKRIAATLTDESNPVIMLVTE